MNVSAKKQHLLQYTKMTNHTAFIYIADHIQGKAYVQNHNLGVFQLLQLSIVIECHYDIFFPLRNNDLTNSPQRFSSNPILELTAEMLHQNGMKSNIIY